MKDDNSRGMFLLMFLLMTALAIMFAFRIRDLNHDIKRLEAKIDSHEDILVPKRLQGVEE